MRLPSDLLTEREVSDLTGVKPGTLRQWRRRDQGPRYVKVGVAVMYRRRVIEKWLAERHREVHAS